MHRDENLVTLKCTESNLTDVRPRRIEAFSEPFNCVTLQNRRIFLADHRQSRTNVAYNYYISILVWFNFASKVSLKGKRASWIYRFCKISRETAIRSRVFAYSGNTALLAAWYLFEIASEQTPFASKEDEFFRCATIVQTYFHTAASKQSSNRLANVSPFSFSSQENRGRTEQSFIVEIVEMRWNGGRNLLKSLVRFTQRCLRFGSFR